MLQLLFDKRLKLSPRLRILLSRARERETRFADFDDSLHDSSMTSAQTFPSSVNPSPATPSSSSAAVSVNAPPRCQIATSSSSSSTAMRVRRTVIRIHSWRVSGFACRCETAVVAGADVVDVADAEVNADENACDDVVGRSTWKRRYRGDGPSSSTNNWRCI